MKRFSGILLLILCLAIAATAFAADYHAGSEVKVKLAIAGNPNKAAIANIAFDIDWKVFEFVKAEQLSMSCLTIPETSGQVFSLFDASGALSLGEFASVTLKIKPDAPEGTYYVGGKVVFEGTIDEEETTGLLLADKTAINVFHIWDDGEITTPATCQAEGVKTFTCTNHGCTATKTEPVPMLTSHTPAAPVQENLVPATCLAAGSCDEVVYCSVCKAEISRTKLDIPMTGHTPAAPVQENLVPATCQAAGSCDEVVYCSACKAEISRTPKTLEKLTAHTDANGDFLCDVCGASMAQPTRKVTVNGGTGSGEYAVGATVSVKANEVEGAAFTRWTGLDGLTMTLGAADSASIAFVMPDKDVQIAAEYTQVKPTTFTVTFMPNGGTGEMKPATGVTSPYALPECGFAAPKEKLFKGWALEEKGEVLATPYQIAADVTLYAIWKDAPLPKFTAPVEPQTVEIFEKEKGSWMVSATHATGYQWYINRNDGHGYVKVNGATGTQYITSEAQLENDGYTYYCIASNEYGTAQSAVFTLKVKPVLPKTGDGTPLAIWCALLMVSAAGVAIMRRRSA